MVSCCCSLAGTRACETCPNSPMKSIQFVPIMQNQKIIEKYENGKLIERTIEGAIPTGNYDFGFRPTVDFTTPMKKNEGPNDS